MSETNENRKNLGELLPPEITGAPVISISGRREITVDGFRGIEEYTEDSVTFKAGKTVISVGGNDLIIRFMSLHTIVIAGYIIKIEFL